VLSACDVDLLRAAELAYQLSVGEGIYGRSAGLAGVWGELISSWLRALLPENAGLLCAERVTLVTLRVWPLPVRHLFLQSFYNTREDVICAARCSVHVPLYLDRKLTIRRANGDRCIDGSIASPRDIVAISADRCRTLLLDHNDDPRIGGSRKMGDFLALRTKNGLDAMIEMGATFMRSEIAAGRLAHWIDAAEEAAAELKTIQA
jgi:hypothetical protein